MSARVQYVDAWRLYEQADIFVWHGGAMSSGGRAILDPELAGKFGRSFASKVYHRLPPETTGELMLGNAVVHEDYGLIMSERWPEEPNICWAIMQVRRKNERATYEMLQAGVDALTERVKQLRRIISREPLVVMPAIGTGRDRLELDRLLEMLRHLNVIVCRHPYQMPTDNVRARSGREIPPASGVIELCWDIRPDLERDELTEAFSSLYSAQSELHWGRFMQACACVAYVETLARGESRDRARASAWHVAINETVRE